MGKKQDNKVILPFVSICTPTFNRRPFIPAMLKCFDHQTYPKDKMEWIIVDDGTDPIEDLVTNHPQIKYYKYDTKMSLGEKRNLMHTKTKGSIIVYMDDDDYYPPERVSHAVHRLQHAPTALCAGSSEMYIYFKDMDKMYQFGPYGEQHATAATFAFRRELLQETSYDNNVAVGEEKHFLKNYTIPFVQLDPLKTILVFSHNHNSFDKRILLEKPNNFIKESSKKVNDFVKEDYAYNFFVTEIDNLLKKYEPGDPKHKPDVLNHINLTTKMKSQMEDHLSNAKKQMEKQMQENIMKVRNQYENRLSQLTMENIKLTDKNKYLESKIKEIIGEKIKQKSS